jgi:predicted peptidase
MASTWTARQGVAVHSTINGFYEFLPDGYTSTGNYPCILFFHGSGEKGNGTTQLSSVLTHGLPKYINDNGGVFPYNAIVLCPQMNVDFPTTGVTGMIDYVRANYGVNRNKISLCGLSMGGGTILDWLGANRLGDLYVSAIAAFCPASVVSDNPSSPGWAKTARLPIKFFHGDADPTVPYSRSTDWIAQLNGGTPIVPAATLYTVSGGNHQQGWNPLMDFSQTIVNGGNVYQWMLAQTRYAPGLNTVHTLRAKIGGVNYRIKTLDDGSYIRERYLSSKWETV